MMSLMTVSCESELDIEKHGNMGSMDTYYTTDENVNTGTASLYLETKSAYYNWFFVKNLLSDDASAVVVSVVTMARWRSSMSIASTQGLSPHRQDSG